MKGTNKKKGFTLVELSLALVFVSIILITIAWLTIHITTTYQKGLAMKAVNATGKEIIDDFSRAISTAPAQTINSLCLTKYPYSNQQSSAYQMCVKDRARKFTYQQRYGLFYIGDDKTNIQQFPTNGVFCTGRYSYIWNTAYVLNTEDYHTAINVADYKAKADFADDEDFRLLKVSDFSRHLCIEHMMDGVYAYNDDNIYAFPAGEDTPTVNIDLLDTTDNNLAIYDLAIFAPAIHKVTSAGFYSGTFILATLRGGIDINATGEFCTDPPDNLDTDFAYCAINKFNFAMRAAGEKTVDERWK